MSLKYSVNQKSVGNLLALIEGGSIAIPEIQRPFVWERSKVRDFLDSLYRGFPVGYIITWQNPDVYLKDGEKSRGKQILIDGQQRITALTTAILGEKIINSDYRKEQIQIAFNPSNSIDDEEEEGKIFEVYNAAIEKSSKWLNDVGPIIIGKSSVLSILKDYCKDNSIEDSSIEQDKIYDALQKLSDLKMHKSE